MCSAAWFSRPQSHRSEGTDLVFVATWLSSLLCQGPSLSRTTRSSRGHGARSHLFPPGLHGGLDCGRLHGGLDCGRLHGGLDCGRLHGGLDYGRLHGGLDYGRLFSIPETGFKVFFVCTLFCKFTRYK